MHFLAPCLRACATVSRISAVIAVSGEQLPGAPPFLRSLGLPMRNI
jgi:hypothetical protein